MTDAGAQFRFDGSTVSYEQAVKDSTPKAEPEPRKWPSRLPIPGQQEIFDGDRLGGKSLAYRDLSKATDPGVQYNHPNTDHMTDDEYDDMHMSSPQPPAGMRTVYRGLVGATHHPSEKLAPGEGAGTEIKDDAQNMHWTTRKSTALDFAFSSSRANNGSALVGLVHKDHLADMNDPVHGREGAALSQDHWEKESAIKPGGRVHVVGVHEVQGTQTDKPVIKTRSANFTMQSNYPSQRPKATADDSEIKKFASNYTRPLDWTQNA